MLPIVRKILVILGILILLICSFGGISMVYFSYKFIQGIWITNILQYIGCMFAYAFGIFTFGFLGLLMISTGINDKI